MIVGLKCYYSMMIFEESIKSLFPSDLFLQLGQNKPVISDYLSEDVINVYRSAGIFSSEQPVRQTVQRLAKQKPEMVYPMHGSCFDGSLLPKYADALMKNEFAYAGMLLGQKMEIS